MVPTTDNMVKEGINNMEIKRNVVKTAITYHRGGNKTEKVKRTDKQQAYKSKKDESIRNKSGSFEKSKASQRTETEDTVKPQKNKVYFISQFI